MAQVPKITTDDIKLSEEMGLPPVIPSAESGVFGRSVGNVPLTQTLTREEMDALYPRLDKFDFDLQLTDEERWKQADELNWTPDPGIAEDMTIPFLSALLTIYSPVKFASLGEAAMAAKVGSKLSGLGGSSMAKMVGSKIAKPFSWAVSKLGGIGKFFASHPKTAKAAKLAADSVGYKVADDLDESTGGVAPALYSAYLLSSEGRPGGYLDPSKSGGVKGAIANAVKLGTLYEVSKPIFSLEDKLADNRSDKADARYAKEDPEMFGRALAHSVINSNQLVTGEDGKQHFIPSPEQERMMRRLKKSDPDTYRKVIQVYKPIKDKADESLGK